MDNRKLHGARKIWHVLRREGADVALHGGAADARLGDQGCGSRQKRGHHEPGQVSALPGRQGEPPVHGSQFNFGRPNKLWLSDFTYVPTWSGTVYVAPRHGHLDQWRFNGSIVKMNQHGGTPFRMSLRTDLAMKNAERRGSM